MEGIETVKKIIDNIENPEQKIRNLRLKINKETAEKFNVKIFSIIIAEFLYCENTRIEVLNELSKGYILKSQDGFIAPYFSKKNDEKMGIEAKNLKVSKHELYRQLVYIYESGRIKFKLEQWGKYIKFNNIFLHKNMFFF